MINKTSSPPIINFRFLLLWILLLVGLDQSTKWLVYTTMQPLQRIIIIPSILILYYRPNTTGFSFWLPALPTWADSAYSILLSLILLLTIPIYYFYLRTRRHNLFVHAAGIGIASAGSGHLLDKVVFPYTVDFLRWGPDYSANLADLYSLIGLFGAAIELSFVLKRARWQGWRHLLACRKRILIEFIAFYLKRLNPCD